MADGPPVPAGGLFVPDVAGADVLSAALAYAERGWYVVPVRGGTKHPGSLLGDGWPRKSSRAPDVVAAWFIGTGHGLALHVGRSGAVVFDVDHPDRLPPALQQALADLAPPHQATRPTTCPGRGHYVFTTPAGRSLSNSLGRLDGGWGEVRGANGVIVVQPSVHPDGGEYRWLRTGPVPELPADLAGLLVDAHPAAEAATDAAVAAFLATYRGASSPGELRGPLTWFAARVAAGESRHQTAVSVLVWALEEARAGFYPAADAVEQIRAAFTDAIGGERPVGSEYAGILAWAVAQARAADLTRVYRREAEAGERRTAELYELTSRAGQPPAVDPTTGEIRDGKDRRSQATQLVDLAVERYVLGRTLAGEAYAVPRTGPLVVRTLRGSTSLRAELARLYLAEHRRAPSTSALASALVGLDGLALEATPVELHQRVARTDGGLLVDLGDDTGQVAHLTAHGWSVRPETPGPLFRRTALTAPLPAPDPDGSIDELRAALAVTDASWPLVAAALVAALLPDIPHPVLLLRGRQGAGKSTRARRLVDLVDPSVVPLRKPPRDADGWVTAAAGSWVVAVDNLSTIPAWLSDSFCRAVTGDVRRQLYTDGDLAVFAFRRQLVLTAIDAGALSGDLADRLLAVECAEIPQGQRVPDAELAAAWARTYPRALGAFYNLACQVLRVWPTVHPAGLPRMADYGHVLAAVDVVLGTNGFATYVGQASELAGEVLEADPVAAALVTFMTDRPVWDGTPGDLLHALGQVARQRDGAPPVGWPKSAQGLGGRLERLAPALADIHSLTVTRGERGGHAKSRPVRVSWTFQEGPDRSPQSPRSPQQAADLRQRSDGRAETAAETATKSPQSPHADHGAGLHKHTACGDCGDCGDCSGSSLSPTWGHASTPTAIT